MTAYHFHRKIMIYPIEVLCECPSCGYKMSRQQTAMPCSLIPCPRCGTPLGELK